MATEVELPDGTILEIPDGADPSAVAKAYLSKQKDQAPATPSFMSELGRGLSTSAANLYRGGTSLAALPFDLLSQGANALERKFYPEGYDVTRDGQQVHVPAGSRPTMTGLQEEGLSSLGVQPERGTFESLVGGATRGLGGAATGFGLGGAVPGVIGQTLAAAPGAQLAAGAAGGASSEGARLLGAGPVTQTVAGLAGGMGGGALAGLKASVRQNVVRQAADLGYQLDPNQVIQGKPVGSLAQRAAAPLAGKAALPAEASLHNQPITQSLIAKDLGLPANEGITKAAITGARRVANQAYQQLRTLTNAQGQPFKVNLARDGRYLGDLRGQRVEASRGVSGTADAGVEKLIRQYERPRSGITIDDVMADIERLRFDARKHFLSDDPQIARQAKVERGIADAMESSLDRQVSGLNPQVVDDWRAARVQLAKLHTVEDAMVGTEVDPRLIARQRDQGAKLSGNLEKIADIAEAMPQVMQANANLGSKSNFGLLDMTTSAGGAGIGALVGGSPEAAVLGALAWPAARYGAKRLALSPGAGVRLPNFGPLGFPEAAGAASGTVGNRPPSLAEWLLRK